MDCQLCQSYHSNHYYSFQNIMGFAGRLGTAQLDKKIIWIKLTVHRVTTLCLKLMPISLACIKENLALCFLSISLPLLLKMVFCQQNCSDLHTVRKNCSRDREREKLLKFKDEGREFAKFLRSLEQFIEAVKFQNNFW